MLDVKANRILLDLEVASLDLVMLSSARVLKDIPSSLSSTLIDLGVRLSVSSEESLYGEAQRARLEIEPLFKDLGCTPLHDIRKGSIIENDLTGWKACREL